MNLQKRARHIILLPAKIIFIILILFVGILIVLKSFSYYPANFSSGFLSGKKDIFNSTLYKYFFYGHILTSPLILLSGLLQFSDYIKKNFIGFHRGLGKIYIFLVVFVSAPSGIVIGYYANGNWIVKAGFIILSILWGFTTLCAYYFIKNKKIQLHKEFMYRSYIFTLSAIFLRLYSYISVAYFHYQGPEAYALISWMSWLPQILIFEILLLLFPKKIIN